MTSGGDTNQGRNWDEARIALGRVSQVLKDNPELGREDILPLLHEVPNYELLPEQVREAVEGLSPDERRLVNNFFTTLAENHFYLEDGSGNLEAY